MKDKFDEIFEESGLKYAKEYSLFKTKYTCGNVVLEVGSVSATIYDGEGYYSAPLVPPTIYDYLRSLLCEQKKTK